jgi:hypothetical protein
MQKLYILPVRNTKPGILKNQRSMKAIKVLCFLILISTSVLAQKALPIDTIKPGKGSTPEQLKNIKAIKVKLLSDSATGEPKKNPGIDTTVMNKYGDLLNDDIKFNPKYPLWKPAVQVLGINLFTNTLDRALGEDFSHVGPASWKYNINKGWEWDSDRFGINFIGHPYTGSMYFNSVNSFCYRRKLDVGVFWRNNTPII